MRQITYSEAINEAYIEAMKKDKNVIAYGLGIDDPKRIFGTTNGLKEQFGSERVFDMPTSENAMTGVAIGASLNGIRPVMCHQRVDFILLAMDQIINNAAKWNFMFGGESSVPITIRLIIGRGWGQGPTHSQSLQALFSHIPGLKVVMPSNAYDAKGLLLSSIFDDNPVIYLEHRWLHNLKGNVPAGDYRVPIGKANRLVEGKDISIITSSYMTIEALHAIKVLKEEGISCDLIDLRSISPIDWETIFTSVKKTGRLLVLDTASESGSISAEIISRVCTDHMSDLKTSPKRLALPNCPVPTSFFLTKDFYQDSDDIVASVFQMLGVKKKQKRLKTEKTHEHDVPGNWFSGPF